MSSIKSVVLAIFLLACCDALDAGILYSYSSVKVAVYDAETNAPISGATVYTQYMAIFLLGPPDSAEAKTDNRGAATIKMATKETPICHASANGYISDFASVSSNSVAFHLYKLPYPRLNIVVPNGYRGPVKLDMRLKDGPIPGQNGMREFTLHTSPTGYVRCEATPLLRMTRGGVVESTISASHQDGKPVAKDDWRLGPSDVGLRWVDAGGDTSRTREIYIVGTSADKEALQARFLRPVNTDPHIVEHDFNAIDAFFDERQPAPSKSAQD